MAQHIVLILNQTVPQIQEPQVGDSYLMIRDVEIQGDLALSGTVDGRDVAADGALLDTALQPGDNISGLTNDSGFTDDQTGAEIKAALFAEADTNNYDDAAVTKLAGIETGAQVNVDLATQVEAEGGIDNTKTMTPLRVAQAIAVFSSGLLNKYDGVSAPGPTNDVNDGYSVGSIWIWSTLSPQEVYRCVDNTAGNAVWIKTSLTVDELATVAVSGDSDDLSEGAVKLLMTVAERSKLAGIEPSATADQSGAEIKALYEAEADTNAFTDAEQTKLAGIEAGATDDMTGAEIKAAYEAEADTNAYDDAAVSKLAGIEAGATADQTGAEIKALYEAEPNTEVFTTSEQTKLSNIETNADVTDTANVTAAGALMDSELTDLAGVKALDTSTLQVKPTEGAFVDGDKTKLDGIEASADVTDTANVTAAGALMDSELTDLTGVKALDTSTLQVKPTEGAFVDGDKTKLDGIETGATADQTASEIEALLYTVTTGITAYATGGQANAVELTTRFNHVGTVATTGDSVKLPTAAAGKFVTVVNKGANAMDLFPGSGDDIDGTGVDTAVSVPAGNSVTVWAADATNWYYA